MHACQMCVCCRACVLFISGAVGDQNKPLRHAIVIILNSTAIIEIGSDSRAIMGSNCETLANDHGMIGGDNSVMVIVRPAQLESSQPERMGQSIKYNRYFMFFDDLYSKRARHSRMLCTNKNKPILYWTD